MLRTSSTLNFQRDFDTIRYKVVTPFGDPAGLFDMLHHGADTADRKNLVLRSLIEAAQSDPPHADCALTLLLLALWPGLGAVFRRAKWRRLGAADELPSEILARATETIRCLELGRVNRIAATILRNIERDLVRARQREVDRENLRAETDPDEIGVDDHTISPVLLHDEVRRLVGADAKLMIRVSLEGFSQAEVAVELGISEAATRKRYQRANRRLHDALRKSV